MLRKKWAFQNSKSEDQIIMLDSSWGFCGQLEVITSVVRVPKL